MDSHKRRNRKSVANRECTGLFDFKGITTSKVSEKAKEQIRWFKLENKWDIVERLAKEGYQCPFPNCEKCTLPDCYKDEIEASVRHLQHTLESSKLVRRVKGIELFADGKYVKTYKSQDACIRDIQPHFGFGRETMRKKIKQCVKDNSSLGKYTFKFLT